MNTPTINPDMIVVARESRGWTQADLEDATGIPQGTLSKFENGVQDISPDSLQAIAKSLSYHPALFQQRASVQTISRDIHYRKRASVTAREQRRIESELHIRHIQMGRLLRPFASRLDHRVPFYEPMEFDGDIERIAQCVRESWKLPSGPVSDVTAVIEAACGIVVQVDFDTDKLVDGAYFWSSGQPPVFYMNKNVPGERYRFSLCHELGHAVMHARHWDNDAEKQADRFSSAFLMPEKDIRDDLLGLTVEKARVLKKHWKVSMSAIIYRAYDLKIITESRYRRLMTTIGAMGYRKNEPWGIPLETPDTYQLLCELHQGGLEYSDDDMGKLMFTDRLGRLPSPSSENQPRMRLVGRFDDMPLFDSPKQHDGLQVIPDIDSADVIAAFSAVTARSLSDLVQDKNGQR